MSNSKLSQIKAHAAQVAQSLQSVTFGGVQFKLRRFKMDSLFWSESMAIAKELALYADDTVVGATTFYVAVGRLLLNEDGTPSFPTNTELSEFIECCRALPDDFDFLYAASGIKEYIENLPKETKQDPTLTPTEVAEKN